MDTTVRDPLIGRTLDGRYSVTARIARGGMATIYSGLDERLDRRVALKVMHPHLADDDEFVDRFIREARSAARLSHPSVVQVFDQGSDGDVLYLAMELLTGRTLREVIAERGALTPREALTVAEPMLDALSAAHRAGLVHRDVKPENVILTDDGRVKVADFGLARAVTGSATQTAVLIGTVGYLAPELVTAGRSDARGDVYAAGVVLFEMLTGRQPFTGEVPMQVAYRHVHEQVPKPSTLVPGLPSELDDVVTAATAREPEDRPADAAAWLAAVRRVRGQLAAEVLDARPDVAPTAAVAGGVPGSPTELFSPAAGPNPTAALPQFGDLRSLRERRRREADEDAFLDDDPDDPDDPDDLDDVDDLDAVDDPADREERDGLPGRAGGPGADRPRDGAGFRASGAGRRASRSQGPSWAPPAAHGEDDELRRLARSRRRRGLAGLLVVLALAVALALGGWYLVSGPGAFTTTPALTNLTEDEARRVLIAEGLEIRVEQGDYSDVVEKDHILRTRPESGDRIRKGGAVSVYLSQGTAARTVPRLVGFEQARAEEALTAAGLRVGGVSEEFSDGVPQGKVAGTAPGPGKELKLGAAVNLVISRGPEPVQLPEVRGQTLDEARGALTDLGLKVEVTEEPRQDVEPGRVLDQRPGPGETVVRTSTVTLVVAAQVETITVPDARNLKADEAERQLREQGFDVQRRGGGPFDEVRQQDPQPGSEVPAGTPITIFVF